MQKFGNSSSNQRKPIAWKPADPTFPIIAYCILTDQFKHVLESCLISRYGRAAIGAFGVVSPYKHLTRIQEAIDFTII